ncbi:MAG: hypothetical protein N2653_09025 [Burkholderiales bacterium]|nr:hypothetical protein [Burkholderiales bacterium]
MRVERYPARSLAADYARAAAGIALCGALLGLAAPARAVAVAAAAAGALFLLYFARTVCRQLTCVAWDETGIRVRGPLGAEIRWAELRAMRLRYYSTRGDREGGWMQLRLQDSSRTVRIDSDLPGFADLARAAAAAAARSGVELDAASAANLRALEAAP